MMTHLVYSLRKDKALNIFERRNKHEEIARYLSTPKGKTDKGLPLYPTLEEASRLFGYHLTHIHRIKREYVKQEGRNGERSLLKHGE